MTEEIKKLIPSWLLNSDLYSVVTTDLEGNYSFINDAFKKRFSFLNIDFIGQPFAKTVHPDDVEKGNKAALECIMNPGKSVNVQLRKPEKEKGVFYVTQWEFSLLQNTNNQPIGIICVGYDFTETRKANIKIQELGSKLKALIDSSSERIILISPENKVIASNKLAKQESKLIYGKEFYDYADIYEFIFPEDTETFEYDFNRALEGEPVKTIRKIANKWFEFNYFPVYDEKKILGVSLTAQDITEKKQLQEYKENLINNIPDLLLVITNDGILKDFSSKNNDYDFKSILGKHYSNYFSIGTSSILETILKEGIKENEVKEFDYYMNVEGEEKYFEARVSKLNETEFIILSRDITEFNKRQKVILRQNEILKDVAWQQSHEMRRPVANILGIGILLRNRKNKKAKEIDRLINMLISSTETLDQVIHKIVYAAAEALNDQKN